MAGFIFEEVETAEDGLGPTYNLRAAAHATRTLSRGRRAK